ncbi:MAG: hypothetical protein KDA25_00655, partial [Phycisphaerales bacterium]|nr:hypothetical protein [Phycisphaerales bacterium]
MPNAVTTSLFQTEYLQALEDWLRRRFRLLCLTCIGLATLDLILTLAVFASTSPWAETAIDAADDVFTIAIVGRFAFPARWRSFSRPTLLRYASRMMLTLGAMMVALQYVQGLLLPDSGASMLAPLFVLHFIACLFLPWKPMESLRPFAPLLVVWAIGVLVLPGDLDWPARIMYAVLLGPAVLVPGLVICGWRLGRHRHEFRLSMVNKHFLSMRQEVGRARAIHETLFPDRWDDGYVRFEY